MKVVHITDEDTKLTKKEKRKVAILKLTENGKYLEGIGIKDDDFFLLTEDDVDETYIAYKFMDDTAKVTFNKESLMNALKLMSRVQEIATQKAQLKEKLSARKESN